MTGQTIILRSDYQRTLAKRLVDGSPVDSVVTFREATRSLEQNAKMWPMLSDISRAEPKGWKFTNDEWKLIMMHGCGWEVQFLPGLDGRPFPQEFRSSKLSVKQMSDLIEFMYAFGSEHGVEWSEPHPDELGSA